MNYENDYIINATEDIARALFESFGDDPFFREDVKNHAFRTPFIYYGKFQYRERFHTHLKELEDITFCDYMDENFLLSYHRFYEKLDSLFELYDEDMKKMDNFIDEPGKYYTLNNDIAFVWNIDDVYAYGAVSGESRVWSVEDGRVYTNGGWVVYNPLTIKEKKVKQKTDEQTFKEDANELFHALMNLHESMTDPNITPGQVREEVDKAEEVVVKYQVKYIDGEGKID